MTRPRRNTFRKGSVIISRGARCGRSKAMNGRRRVRHGCGRVQSLPAKAAKDSEKALVFSDGGEVSLVRRAGYDWLFSKKQYDANPYQTEPSFFSRAGIRAEGGF